MKVDASLLSLYESWAGQEPCQIEQLAGAGSNRVYYRLIDGHGRSVIGVVGTSKEENHAFIYLSRHFGSKNLPVPGIIAASSDESCYLLDDLGSTSLYDAIAKGRKQGGCYDEHEVELLERTIRQLPRFQFIGHEGLDYNQCYPQPNFDRKNVFFDLNYFKYCFLKATGVDFHELFLEQDFEQLAADLTTDEASGFMYRDFQARNVMLDEEGNPWFIDFQGGRRGPFYYDVASFLWQASANYPDKLREHLVSAYYDSMSRYVQLPPFSVFMKRLQLFVFFRTLQVLGAYGFRGYFERKRHFLDSIPHAISNLATLLQQDLPYEYLCSVLRQVIQLPQYQRPTPQETLTLSPSKYDGKGPLVVRVFSFSYKKGIPDDTSGNGGGYVFDCRSTHNPGRYAEYRELTGLDAPVIQFLEDDGEILSFLENVYALADRHVERYMQRGFTSLMFSFGCTGGQHRSVYSAQHLAMHINKKYGVEVHLCHREQGISQVLPAADRSDK